MGVKIFTGQIYVFFTLDHIMLEEFFEGKGPFL
jgi:hypothetical protein